MAERRPGGGDDPEPGDRSHRMTPSGKSINADGHHSCASHGLAKGLSMKFQNPLLFRSRFSPVGVLLIVCIAAVTGCGSNMPTAPDSSIDTWTASTSDRTDGSHQMWGVWHVTINPVSMTIGTVPDRSSNAHWNVTQFVQAPACPSCLSFTNLQVIDPDHLSVTISITHPFSGKPNLDGFDVKGIGLSTPDLSFPSGTVSTFIENADGYTSRWSSGSWADINPCVDFATDDPERRFASGTTHEREIIIRKPESGPLVFDYVIDACWLPPDLVNENIPSLSKHCNEAFEAEIDVTGQISPLPGSMVDVVIQFHDWQGDGENATVTVEIPSLLTVPLQAEFIGENDATTFKCTLQNQKSAPAGTYQVLVSIADALNNPENNSLTWYGIAEVIVSDQIPEMTGIEISPDAVSLPDTGSNADFDLYAIYSDNSRTPVADAIDWNITGTDLNGHTLAEIDSNGTVTRLSSRWWGGTATVTADYLGYHDDAIAYCEDPFADEIEVSFGELNVEGEGFANPVALLGPPSGGGVGGGSLDSCSLGYGGVATLGFTDNVIVDGPGVDFIVFENPFYSDGCFWNDIWQHGAWNETAIVEVSQDGTTWYRIPNDFNPANETCGIQPYKNPSSFTGIAGNTPVFAGVEDDGSLKDGIDPTDPVNAGGDTFDLATTGLAWCRYVRLIDTGKESDFPGTGQYDDDGDLIMDFGKITILGSIEGSAGFDGDAVAAVHSASPLEVK